MMLARVPDVLWRLGADRVLVRRVNGPARDLTGLAALVWVALDVSRSLDAVTQEIVDVAGAQVSDVEHTISLLEADGWLERRHG